MEKVLIVQRLSGNNDAGMEKAAKKSLIQASCLCRTLNLPVCWFTSKETIWSSAAVKVALSHSWSHHGLKSVFFIFLVFMILMNERQLHNSLTFRVLDVLSQFEKSQMISWSRIRSSWSGSHHHAINSKVMNFPKQGHYYYSCPWPNTFKKSFKSS